MNTDIIKTLQPSTLVIFGITGDLASRKLLPSLYNLAKHDMLPDHLQIVGITRRGITVDKLLDSIRGSIESNGSDCDLKALAKLGSLIEILTMDLLQPAEYVRLRDHLDAIEDKAGICMNRLFYLAIPAQSFGPVVRQLGENGLNKSCQHGTGGARLLIEKPFGYDLVSAHELIDSLNVHFSEEQIYRIDHYLAKETAQNILIFRFENPIFKDIWNNHNISSIMITAAEEIGIEGRANFYEQTGALRDLIQSHLLQLLALVTMDEPASLTAAAIHRQKLALLKSIIPIAPNKIAEQTVRGQYEGYRAEVENSDSVVETYAAVRLDIDSERWRHVPILLRTGKAMAEKVVDITIVFSDRHATSEANVLTIRIQPNEGISLKLLAKKPGFTSSTEAVQMDFCYGSSFPGEGGHPDPYERVLMDAFRGDKTLFATSEEVLAGWHILENVITMWARDDQGLEIYKRGTWGPSAADALAKDADTAWLTQTLKICSVHSQPPSKQ